MITADDKTITASPMTYGEWLECFEILQSKTVTGAEFDLISGGKCPEAEQTVEFFETQLIKTVNAIIKRYIKNFNRELEMHTVYGDYEGLSRLFVRLAKGFKCCLFFEKLEFLSKRFRKELTGSVIAETTRFWNNVTDAIYSQCIEFNSAVLEDELYMIKRIRLYQLQGD